MEQEKRNKKKKERAGLVALLILSVALGRTLGLQGPYLLVWGLMLAAFLPVFLGHISSRREEEEKFWELNAYLEQFLYSFRKEKKVLSALQETRQIFAAGRMADAIDAALSHIGQAYLEDAPEANGLKIIEGAYPEKLTESVHRFCLQAEQNGGDCEEGIALLLETRRLWADRQTEFQKEKSRWRNLILVSLLLSLGVCGLVFQMSLQTLQGADSGIVQETDTGILQESDTLLARDPDSVITLGVLFFDLLIFDRADKKLSGGRQRKKGKKEAAEEEEELCDRYRSYDTRRLLGRMGKAAAKRRLTKEIEKVFSLWLMQLALLLQSETVYAAIFKSYPDAPKVLKPFLKDLIYELKTEPGSLQPYQHFLEEFSLPEVHSAMKMLYSLSEGGGGNARAQIAELTERNFRLYDRACKLKNEDALAGMYGLFLAPQLTGGIKLMTDLLLVLLAAFQGIGV